MSNDKMVDKVRKLLALGDSPNQAEAEAAMQKAVALMTEYNIQMHQIKKAEKQEEGYVRHWTETVGKLPIEHKYVADIVVKFFFVKIVHQTVDGAEIMNFIGTAQNVAVGEYVYNSLSAHFYVLWQQYKMKTGARTRDKQSYYMGLWEGLTAKLKEERSSVETQMGLVLVADPGLQKAVGEMFPNLRTRASGRINITNQAARSQGFQDGKQININKGVGGGSTNKKIGGF